MAKAKKPKLTDEETVASYMDNLSHSLKPEMEVIRTIIKASDKRIRERIKWNAPSYYHVQDIVTFGPRKQDKLLLVFHHPSVVKVHSKLLEGDYKDRRLAWFSNMNEIKENKNELTRIMKEIVAFIDNAQ